MAFVPANFFLPHPVLLTSGAGSIGFAATLLDAIDERQAYVFQCPKAGTLRKFGARTGTVTTWTDVRYSFQNLNAADAFPDEVETYFRDVTGVDADDNVWKESGDITDTGADGGNKFPTVTQGQIVAAVIRAKGAGPLNMAPRINNASGIMGNGLPYAPTKLGGTWSASPGNTCIVFALWYDGDSAPTYVQGFAPILNFGSTTYNSGSAADVICALLSFKAQVQVDGAIIGLRVNTAGGTYRVIIVPDNWNGTDAPIATTGTLDTDHFADTTGTPREVTVGFTTKATLEANTLYRVITEPLSAVGVTLFDYSLVSATYLPAFAPDLNVLKYGTAKDPTGTASWTDTDGKSPHVSLHVVGIHDGSGGGGGANTKRLFRGRLT